MNKIYHLSIFLTFLFFAEIIQACIPSNFESQSLFTDTYYLLSSQQFCESNLIIFWKFDPRILCKSYRVSPKIDCINLEDCYQLKLLADEALRNAELAEEIVINGIHRCRKILYLKQCLKNATIGNRITSRHFCVYNR